MVLVADDHMVNQFDFQELPGANEVARHLDVGLRRGAFPTNNGLELHEIDREALMQRTGYERSLLIRLLAKLGETQRTQRTQRRTTWFSLRSSAAFASLRLLFRPVFCFGKQPDKQGTKQYPPKVVRLAGILGRAADAGRSGVAAALNLQKHPHVGPSNILICCSRWHPSSPFLSSCFGRKIAGNTRDYSHCLHFTIAFLPV